MTGTLDALAAVLTANPDAYVGAVNTAGRYVDAPEGIPLGEHPRLTGRWALDLVVPADRGLLVNAWAERASEGGASATVQLVTGGTATFHVFALTDDFGVDAVVAIPHAGADFSAALQAPAEVARPKFCRMIRDEAGRTIDVDEAAPIVLGLSRETLLSGRPPIERIHPDDRGTVIESWMATLANETDGHRCRVRVHKADSVWTWMEMTSLNRLDDPERPHVIVEMLDISEEMAAYEAVADREQLLHRLAEALPLGVLQLDTARRVVYKNDYLSTMLGIADATTMDEQFVGVAADDRSLLTKAFAVAIEQGTDDDVVVRVTRQTPRGERLVRVITKALHTGSGEVSGVIACISDVTEATLMGRELERRATFDALTGCHNRASILAHLERAVGPGGTGAAAVFLDLDDFKSVNDESGHAAGDEVLKATVKQLESATRGSDVVGRLGGDEFLIVCQDVPDPSTALALAERIASSIRGTRVEVADCELSASLGVAWAAPGSVDADHLVRAADEAMYASKREGAGRPHLAP